MLARHMMMTALVLALFALIGTGMVAFTFDNTEQRIAQNERDALLKSLHALVPPGRHDNDLSTDIVQVTSREYLGTNKPSTIYRARLQGNPVAVIISTTAPDGYGGAIKILVAINNDGELAGVRVVSHRETPGLGDAIDIERSSWIEKFSGYTLQNPGNLGWNVKKDGGIFDQFTGATITPRAVVKAVHKGLEYYASHRDELFRQTPTTKSKQ